MSEPALKFERDIVIDVDEPAANDRPASATGVTLMDLITALQDAADEAGTTADEADALVVASFQSVQRYVVPAPYLRR